MCLSWSYDYEVHVTSSGNKTMNIITIHKGGVSGDC